MHNSKSQRHVAHHGESRHRDEANLVVAVVVGMAVAIADGGVDPAAGGVATVEDVVEVQAEDYFFGEEIPRLRSG